MRKGLAVMALLVFLILVGAAVLIVHYTTGPGNSGTTNTTKGPVVLDLSFKPFTLNELLHHGAKVDLKTSGKRIKSPKFAQIEERTSTIRKLPLKEQIPLIEASEGVVLVQLVTGFETETPRADIIADQKLLEGLGLLQPGQNLETIMVKVLTEQIAGSYDSETKEITVVAGKGLGSTADEVTMSHEVCHGLQDQNFNLNAAPLDNKAYNGDNSTAVQALVEGDATNTMLEYAQTYISMQDLLKMQQEGQQTSSPELDAAPLYLRRSLLFPYEKGLEFVQALQENGGDVLIDQAFKNPPLSTELIMHPKKYIEGTDSPRVVAMPDLAAALGKGWKKINDDCMGEFDIQVWFEQYAPAKSVEVSEGWGGNTIQYYQGTGKDYLMPNMTVWDHPLDAEDFFDDYVKLLEGRFKTGLKKIGSTASSYVYQGEGAFYYCGMAGDTTLALQSPNRQTLNAALANYPQMVPVP